VLAICRGEDEDGEQQDVADDADRPRPDPPAHAADRGGEAEAVADDLPPGDVVAADGQMGRRTTT
jgi:hypothetical protein